MKLGQTLNRVFFPPSHFPLFPFPSFVRSFPSTLVFSAPPLPFFSFFSFLFCHYLLPCFRSFPDNNEIRGRSRVTGTRLDEQRHTHTHIRHFNSQWGDLFSLYALINRCSLRQSDVIFWYNLHVSLCLWLKGIFQLQL